MNEILTKLLLAGDKFMPEMHLKQPGFTYSACGPFTKNKERIQKFKETGDTSYIYENELDIPCFQHDMAYGDFKDLARRTDSDKILRNKAFDTAKNPKHDGYQRGLASTVYKFFDKKSTGGGIGNNNNNNNNIKQNLLLAEELHKPIIKKFKKRKVYSRFRDNILGAGLPNCSEEVFISSKIKNKVPWTYVVNDLNGEEIIGTFYEKELPKTNQKEFRIETVIKRKDDKLYVKWKGYDDSFNS